MQTYVAAGASVAPQATPTFDPRRPWSNNLDPDDPPMSEDCLFLNLFTPGVADAGKRPVMVFLHGGGWASGSGTRTMFDGTRLARQGDTVVIAVNHRLNLFGYLYLAQLLGEDYADSGNCGILDIIAALEWTRDNAASFGGDPGNITVFGWSSGGSEVCQLLAMPAAAGLFHRAIVQSGALLTLRTREEAAHAAERVLAGLNLSRDQAERLLQVPASELMRNPVGGAPTFDGRSVPRQIWAPDAPPSAAQVPLIIGGTDSELSVVASNPVFALDFAGLSARLAALLEDHADRTLGAYRRAYPTATPGQLLILIATGLWTTRRTLRLAELHAAQRGAPVFLYQWTWRSRREGGKYLSPHGIDLPFVWDNLKLAGDPADGGSDAEHVARRVSRRWLAFARSGSPNAPAAPHWQPYTSEGRATLLIDQTDHLVDDPHGEIRSVLAEIPENATGRVFAALRS